MKKNKIILTEGYKNIGIVFTVAIVLNLLVSDCLSYIAFFVGIALLYIYRDTYRHIFKNTQSVLAPIDGRVTAIDKVNGKYKIHCKVGLLDNHVLRAPVDGVLKMKKYRHGLHLNPNTHRASLYNEQMVLSFGDLKVKLISGLCNNNIKRVAEKKISQGDKISVFIDGMVVITIQDKNDLLINIGDKLTSGQSILFKK